MASKKRARLDEFTTAIGQVIDEYKENVVIAVGEAVKKAASQSVRDLKRTSPVGYRGDYSRGWRAKKIKASYYASSFFVHNKTDYQLAHLLEKGHALRNGGRSRAFPHIAPAEQKAIKNLEEAIEKVAKG